MKKTLLSIAAALLGLIAGLGLWGLTLPRESRASSHVTISAPPESVYAVMRDQGSLAAWWHEVDQIEAVPGADSLERWKENMGGAKFTVIVVEAEPGTRFTTVIDTVGSPSFGGSWTHDVAPAPDGGTTVTVTENGWMANPYFRVAMQFNGPQETIDSYLIALGAKFAQTVTPTHVIP